MATELLSARPVAFSEVPVLDISRARSADPAERRALAAELRRACTEVGFFYVSHHGVEQSVIDRAFACARTFFALPLTEKSELDVHKTDAFRGYLPLLGENVDPANRGDLNESFNVGPATGAFVGVQANASDPNQWPSSLGESFKSDVMAYYDAVQSVGTAMFPILALALNLPERFFDDKTREAASCMRLLHYPPQTGTDDRQLGIGAHTDYEVLTILAQDSAALQVRNLNGEWIAADPIPGTFICNLGDQLARWSNDIFLSTTHRAINRTSQRDRYSIPLFVGVDYDVILEPLSTCVGPDRPPRYEPIKAGDYLKSRLEATYGHAPLATTAAEVAA